MMNKKQMDYQNAYNKMHYSRLTINVENEQRSIINAHWKARGFSSFSAYAKELIRQDMENNSKNH